MATVESRNVFYGVNKADSADRILLEAATEIGAKVELLDQLGYTVEQTGQSFIAVDVDHVDDTIAITGAKTFEQAHDLMLKTLKWGVSEPIELIGGSLPGGMGFDDEQNRW